MLRLWILTWNWKAEAIYSGKLLSRRWWSEKSSSGYYFVLTGSKVKSTNRYNRTEISKYISFIYNYVPKNRLFKPPHSAHSSEPWHRFCLKPHYLKIFDNNIAGLSVQVQYYSDEADNKFLRLPWGKICRGDITLSRVLSVKSCIPCTQGAFAYTHTGPTHIPQVRGKHFYRRVKYIDDKVESTGQTLST